MEFDSLHYAYPSHRNVVYARGGMACSTSPLASQIGCRVMEQGGTAIDAACAMAAAMPVLEPTGNGLGADGFALIWADGKLHAINGSGVSPRAISPEAVRAAGFSTVPKEGWIPTMVPGAMGMLAEVNRRFGTVSLPELAAPAVHYAREGFPVPVNVARQLAQETVRIAAAFGENPTLFAPVRALFTRDGAAIRAGELLKNPAAADTLEELAATGGESLYRGALADKIVAWSKKTGGFFEKTDFAALHPAWVEPLHTCYKGYDVFELPPNGHGITVLMALNILSGMQLPAEKDCAETWHKMAEALKLAFQDTKTYVADPRFMKTRVDDLLSPAYAARRRALIGKTALLPTAGEPACGGTVYFCTADSRGNMVSWIQSNYTGIGSLVAVPGTGITLQNRGANFSMDAASDNVLAGGKKAYHTIIPGFLARDGQPVGPFGVMGGFMQPQGHLQVIVNAVDYGMNPQECLDAPRFQWVGGRKLQLEREVPAHLAQELARRGHEVEIVNSNLDMGRGQIIWRSADGTLCGGTEPRADGCISAF